MLVACPTVIACPLGAAAAGAGRAAATGAGSAAAAGAGSSPCSSAPVAGSSTIQLVVDGRPRSVLVHVPTGAPAGSQLPLVVALHGFRGDGAAMARGTGFSALADARQFVVAYPSAPGGQWALYAGEPRAAEDVDFIRSTVDQLSAGLCIDPRRIFLVGVSNGGGEAARVACVLADRLAGVAMVAGDYRSLPACHPSRPLSVLEIHGLKDPVVPYRGRSGDHSGSVPGFVSLWRRLDRCQEPGSSSRPSAHTIRLSWRCSANTQVSQLKILNAGHVWPGSPPPGRLPGPRSATTVIWQFFGGLG